MESYFWLIINELTFIMMYDEIIFDLRTMFIYCENYENEVSFQVQQTAAYEKFLLVSV